MKALFSPHRFFPSCLLACLSLPLVAAADGDFAKKEVTYTIDGSEFRSTVIWDRDEDDRRPGILMVPNWMGPSEAAFQKAEKIADDDYVVMVVDMYGADVRPTDSGQASEAAGEVRGDREMMRARAARALEEFRSMGDIPLQSEQIAAIGFCFGGGTVLELGRSGADVDAIVSFHGDLMSPTLKEDAGETQAQVLVLHGAEDPYVPQEDVQAFVSAMLETDVDWTLVQFSGAVHSFTNPEADTPGESMYDERTAKRAFEMMEGLFDEIWDQDD